MDSDIVFSVEILSSALNDMTEIISSFIMLGSKNGANRIKNKFNKAVSQIINFPFSGILIPDEKLSRSGYRMIIIEKYLMFYRVFESENKVYIYRVLNGRRNYPALLNKLENDTKE